MTTFRTVALLAATLCAGALFGFYVTMSVSIMPGLDLAEPYAAIHANQHIGRATQSSAFFVALLGTPVAIAVAIALMWSDRNAKRWLVVSLLDWVAMMAVTMFGNVPLNGILDGLDVSPDDQNLEDLWLAYSVDWQVWNWLRVSASGISLIFIALALQNSSAQE